MEIWGASRMSGVGEKVRLTSPSDIYNYNNLIISHRGETIENDEIKSIKLPTRPD